jgi:hypothetical protein
MASGWTECKVGCRRVGKFEKRNSAEICRICQCNTTPICLPYQLPVSTVDSINEIKAAIEREGVFKCNVGRRA